MLAGIFLNIPFFTLDILMLAVGIYCNIDGSNIEVTFKVDGNGLPLNAGGEIVADCLAKVLKMKRRKRSNCYSAPLAF